MATQTSVLPAPNPPKEGAELVSVVVPARNEEETIGRCLRSILSQDWQELEVLVVDGGSSDGTGAVVERIAADDQRVRLLDNPAQVTPAALNIGLAEARGRWLVRVDAHAEIPPDYVRIAHDLLSTESFGAVGGRKDGEGRSAAGRAIAAVMSSRFGVGGSTYHFGAEPQDVEHVPFGAYPVALLRGLDGWNEELRVNQDFELDYRVRKSGRRIRFDPRMSISWQSRQTIGDLAKQYFRYGRGKARVAALHPRSVRPRHLLPPLLVGALGTAGLLAFRHPRASIALISPYLGLVGVGTVVVGRRVDGDARPFIAPALLAMHICWGTGFWQGAAEVLLEALPVDAIRS